MNIVQNIAKYISQVKYVAVNHVLHEGFNWQNCLLMIIVGALTTLSFAPFFQSWILWLTLPIFAMKLRSLDAKTASAKSGGEKTKGAKSKRTHHFIYGWCYGLGYFLASTYWIANALLVDAATYFWYIPFATIGLSALLGCYFGLMALLLRHKSAVKIVPYSFCFAGLWLLCELLRSYAFTGFPWNLLGYAWGASDVSIQSASIGGVFFLSLITALLALLPLWLRERQFIATTCALTCLCAMLGFGAIRLANNPTNYVENVQLRVVQAAIPQSLKWEAAHKVAAFREHLALSASPAEIAPTHIIWSESSMTTPFEEGDYVAKMLSEAAPINGSLITGVVRVEKIIAEKHNVEKYSDNENIKLYNSMQSITSTGEIDAIYDKHHLVPFGEYMPLRSLIPFEKLTSGTVDFASGSGQNLQQTKGAPAFHTIICYEAIFPHLSQNEGAKWLLNLTNDAWFGNSTGPRQHLQMARMRAVEQGLPIIRAAGSGISAVIDPYGRMLKSLEINVKNVLDSPLPQPSEKKPIAANYGIILSMIFLLLFLLIGNIFGYMKLFQHKKIIKTSLQNIFVILFATAMVSACGDTTVRENLGLVRTPPDEFKVVSRAPLTVPKEFFLYPPDEAAERAEVAKSGNSTARDAIFGNDNAPNDDYLSHYQSKTPNVADAAIENVNSSEIPSNAESSLLQKMNVVERGDDIRQILRTENDATTAKEDDFLEQLRTPIKTSEPIVDADKERTRLKQNKDSNKPINSGEVPTVIEKKTLLDKLF